MVVYNRTPAFLSKNRDYARKDKLRNVATEYFSIYQTNPFCNALTIPQTLDKYIAINK